MNNDIIELVNKIKSKRNNSDMVLLIKKFEPLIKRMSWRNHLRFHLPFEDYNSEGVMGLIRGIETYDNNIQYNFSHLYQWLYRYSKNYMFRYTIKNNSIVRYVLNQQDRKDFIKGELPRPLNFEFNDESEDFSVSYRLSPEVKYLQNEKNKMIHEKLNSIKLTVKQRKMLNLWMDTESFTKTGEIMNTTRQNVEATIKLILERLKPKFESFL